MLAFIRLKRQEFFLSLDKKMLLLGKKCCRTTKKFVAQKKKFCFFIIKICGSKKKNLSPDKKASFHFKAPFPKLRLSKATFKSKAF